MAVIASARDPSLSQMERDRLYGNLRGFRTFYKVTNPAAAAFLDIELAAIQEWNRATNSVVAED